MAMKQPTIQLIDLPPDVAHELEAVCYTYRSTQMEIRSLEEVKRELKPHLERLAKSIFSRRKIRTVEGENWLFIEVRKEQRTLSREKLLELGVSMGVIEAATVVTPRVEYHVREKKQ